MLVTNLWYYLNSMRNSWLFIDWWWDWECVLHICSKHNSEFLKEANTGSSVGFWVPSHLNSCESVCFPSWLFVEQWKLIPSLVCGWGILSQNYPEDNRKMQFIWVPVLKNCKVNFDVVFYLNKWTYCFISRKCRYAIKDILSYPKPLKYNLIYIFNIIDSLSFSLSL